MNTKIYGQKAEIAVASRLQALGYKILHQNWKTPVCEIDIIAKKDGVIYFVEVKYRLKKTQGDGFEYINHKKQRQMDFAARIWLSQSNWDGDYRFMAVAVSGLNFDEIKLVEL